MCANAFGLVSTGRVEERGFPAISNQKLQSRSVFALPRDPLRPTDLHEGGDVHRDVREGEHTAYDGVLWQRLVDQYADTTSPDILGHPIQEKFRLFQDINASEQADAQLDGVGKARRCPVVHYFPLVTDKCSAKWQMIAQLQESVNSTKGLVFVRVLR